MSDDLERAARAANETYQRFGQRGDLRTQPLSDVLAEAIARAVIASLPKRICSVCTATVAEFPEAMCCHCHEMPWRLSTILKEKGKE